MDEEELSATLYAHTDNRIGTHWDTCHHDGQPRLHAGCAVGKLVREVRRLRAELAEQKAANLALAERLAACSEVLGRAAEKGRVCGCQTEKDKTSFGLPATG